MKKIILLALLLATQMIFADQLPESWIDDSEIAEEANLPNLENTFDAHSSMASNFVEKDAGKKGWEMFGYVTTFGVTSSGKIGLLASSGSSAIEIYWRKRAQAPITPKTNEPTEDINDSDVVISNDYDVDENVDAVMTFIKSKKEIKNVDRLRVQIKNEVLNLKKTFDSIELMEKSPNHNFNWYVKMLRLDLTVSAEGLINTGTTLGGELSVKIFWTRKGKTNQFLANNMDAGSINNVFTKTITNFMANLESLEIEDRTGEAKKQGFELKMIRVGLGMSASGNIVIGKGTGSSIFNVMYVKKTAKNPSFVEPLAPQNLFVEDIDGSLITLTSKQFIKGMNKSFKMSERIIEKSAKKLNRKYEPFMIWNMFSFTRGKSVGLTKVNGVGQLHLFFMK